MKRGAGILFLLLAAGLYPLGAGRPDAGGAGVPPAGADPKLAPWLGVASCTSSACHGGGGPETDYRNAYTTWIANDPHTRACEVLFEDASAQIMHNLGGAYRGRKAYQEGLCLRCHADPDGDGSGPRLARGDGVGCESCHGPAGRWLDLHYKDEWKQRTPAEKAALGMWDTKSVAGRARVCAGCHVGAPGRDVDHDLIAAGHPRLNFEFGAYHANLPRHWDGTKDAVHRDEVRAWAVGQVVSAGAALRLLEHRAKGAEGGEQPWPEFAEYGCFACHHDLRAPSWRQQRGYAKRTPGALHWGDWYYAVMPHALAAGGGEVDGRLSGALEELRAEMERPGPDRGKVAQEAAAAAKLLEAYLGGAGPEPGRQSSAALLRTLTREATPVAGWDAEAQRYLALRAVEAAGGPPTLRTLLDDLANRLRFPKGYDSPKGFAPEAIRPRLRKTEPPPTK